MDANHLLMLADVARLRNEEGEGAGGEGGAEGEVFTPLDGSDHCYLARDGFELIVNSTHDYYDRVAQADVSESPGEHGYSFPLPVRNKESDLPPWSDDAGGSEGIPMNSLIHGVALNEEARCEWADCEFVASSDDILLEHVQTHLKRGARRCEWRDCSKAANAYAARYLLSRHIISHTACRPFACTECDLRFRTEERRLTHEKVVHRGVENVECGRCGARFKTSSERRKHELRKHLDGRLPCAHCGRVITAGAMTRHVRRKHAEAGTGKQ